MTNKRLALIAIVASVAAAAVAGYRFAWFPVEVQSEITRIRVGVLPDEDVTDLNRRHGPLLDHLRRQTGLSFELVIPRSYADLLDRFGEQEMELAYFGGFTFVRAHLDHNAQPLVMRDVDLQFTTYFVVKRDGPLRDCFNLSCEELAGKVITFGSRLSTSGHLMPRHFLKTEKGIDPERVFSQVRYSGAHDRTVYQTRDGDADLGAVNSEIFRTMRRDGRLEHGQLQIVWESPPYPDNVWAVSDRLTEALRTKLRDAFLSLETRNEDDERILSLMGARGFVPVGWQEFEPLRDVANSLGLLARGSVALE